MESRDDSLPIPPFSFTRPERSPTLSRRLCALCNASVGDVAVVAITRLWHPDHICRNGCKPPIKQTYQTDDNFAYGVVCFAANFNPKCAGCNDTLVDTSLLALDRHWHHFCSPAPPAADLSRTESTISLPASRTILEKREAIDRGQDVANAKMRVESVAAF